jgi:hypothetical protein
LPPNFASTVAKFKVGGSSLSGVERSRYTCKRWRPERARAGDGSEQILLNKHGPGTVIDQRGFCVRSPVKVFERVYLISTNSNRDTITNTNRTKEVGSHESLRGSYRRRIYVPRGGRCWRNNYKIGFSIARLDAVQEASFLN